MNLKKYSLVNERCKLISPGKIFLANLKLWNLLLLYYQEIRQCCRAAQGISATLAKWQIWHKN